MSLPADTSPPPLPPGPAPLAHLTHCLQISHTPCCLTAQCSLHTTHPLPAGVGLVVTLLVLLVAALFVFRYRHQLRHRYQEFKDGGATDTRQGSMGLLKGSLLSASAGMDRAGSMLARLRSRNASRSGSMGMSDSAQGYGDSMQADLEMPGPRGARPLMADASTNTRISECPGLALGPPPLGVLLLCCAPGALPWLAAGGWCCTQAVLHARSSAAQAQHCWPLGTCKHGCACTRKHCARILAPLAAGTVTVMSRLMPDGDLDTPACCLLT